MAVITCQKFRSVYLKISEVGSVRYPYQLGKESWRWRKDLRELEKHEKECASCRVWKSEYDEVFLKDGLQRDLGIALEYFAIMEGITERGVARLLRKRLNTPALYKPMKDALEPLLKHFAKKGKLSLIGLRDMLVNWLEERFPQ